MEQWRDFQNATTSSAMSTPSNQARAITQNHSLLDVKTGSANLSFIVI